MNIKENLRRSLLENMEDKASAGVLVKCTKTNHFLLLKRNSDPHKNHWSMIAGGLEGSESQLEGLEREVMEETKIPSGKIKYTFKEESISVGGKKPFFYYEGTVDEELTPELNDENTDFIWCSVDNLPTPMFPKTADKIKNFS